MSSVVIGFEEFRQAAREGIEAAGGEPVLVNEDFPAMAASSRNVCLDAVASSDYLVLIVGGRGGWTAPSGKLVVEEELEEARRRKLPVIAFVQEGVERDADARRFERQLSDFVTGGFRLSFRTPSDLRTAIERSLTPQLRSSPRRAMSQPRRDHFSPPHAVPNTTMLRFVLTPEREEEVIEPLLLASEDFRQRVLELGHDRNVRLFSYAVGKNSKVERGALIVEQHDRAGRHGEGEIVLLQIFESGELVIDTNVSGRRPGAGIHDMLPVMVVPIEDIEAVLRLCFAFSRALYDTIDPFQRHQTFLFNTGLSGLGFRTLERNPQPRKGYGMSMRGERTVIVAHEQVRRVSRQDLALPDAEIQRAVLRLEQKSVD